MSRSEKMDYIRTYYWGPILLGVIALVIIGSSLYRHFTKKDQVLYVALLNTAIGDDLGRALNQDYLSTQGLDQKRNEVLLYRDLYLSDSPSDQDHEMAYASRIKLLATINSKRLDLAIMNREAYDILSRNDYLLDLTELAVLDESLYRELAPILTDNTVIIEDNAIEFNLNEAETYQAVTKEAVNGIDISGLLIMRNAGLSGKVYLGIIANTPRLSQCCDYLNYILGHKKAEGS